MVKPGYKQTEIGVIPEDWEAKKIGSFARICMCKRIFADQTTNIGEIPFYKIGTFGGKPDAYISQSLYTEYKNKYSFPEKGDVLISAAGTLGRTVVFDGKDSYFQDSNIVWLDIDNTQICNEYLKHYYEVIKWAASEGSTISRLYNGIIESTYITVPPLAEQKRIAKALSDVDELIASLEKLIEKKKAIKQGVMQELLTGKRRLPGFSGEWKSVCLLEIGHFIKGSGISRADANSGKLPAVRYGELYTKHTDYVKSYYSHISLDVAATATPVTYGAILFAASGETKEEIGKCAAIIEDLTVYAGGDILIFVPDKPIHPVFLGTLLNTPEVCKQKAQRGQGDAIVHIHADSLSQIKVQIPNYDEQAAVADMLLSTDREIDLLKMKLAKARQVKQGMMQQLLTGRTRFK